ncbi:alpha/beta fold hydrolase [Shewanella loihica]|uniref:Alpha/beta hydrolase fold n=1 Tax=Shewanella loihica (strain ATCC BAA-1088 / PV-4) TaxID=323850 RepID=A3QJE1_SHELP|nr:alpha/beta fold hydrolase [Shewanella loihica]ABO25589.1 alpha/beta hydrolase fold [Shewanella loihica PV-4]
MSTAPVSTSTDTIATSLPAFSSELTDNRQQLDAFWQGVEQGYLTTGDGLKLAYCVAAHPESNQAIVISSGRVEAYLKYQELIFDLYQLGYSVYALDHRGQGLSDRLTDNPHQGHVAKFSDYVDDLGLFVDTLVIPKQHDRLFLVGHSMGGTIATLYLQQAPKVFDAAVLSAPMYGICLPMPKPFVRWLAGHLDNGSSSKPNYVLGGKNYQPVPFEQNELTHSAKRYQDYRRLYETYPQLQLGSPTNRWLTESLDACEQAVEAAKHTQTPILILQAEEDSIVDNRAQDAARGEHCHLFKVAHARHEIFIERDSARNQALGQLADFLSLHA